MRGISTVRNQESNAEIFDKIDVLLDAIPQHLPHLLIPETNCLHYLRTIRFQRTEARATYVSKVYSSTTSETVKRACIDCWRIWKDRPSFTRIRNLWSSLSAEQQRMLWLAGKNFGDEGEHFRKQIHPSLAGAWRLGIEPSSGERNSTKTFENIYTEWKYNGV